MHPFNLQVDVTEGNALEVADFVAIETTGSDDVIPIDDISEILMKIADAGSGDIEVHVITNINPFASEAVHAICFSTACLRVLPEAVSTHHSWL